MSDLRCRACDRKHNPFGALVYDLGSVVDVRDGTCSACFLAFDKWARERGIHCRPRSVHQWDDTGSVIDFARPDVAVAFDAWMEQRS